MKHLIRLSTILMLLLIGGMGFSSCSNYDDYEEDVNYGAKVAGTYVGTAVATYQGSHYMTIEGMKVIVTRSSNNYVDVVVRTADDAEIFEEDSYEIFPEGNNYRLVYVDVPEIQAVIDQNGNMTYDVPNFYVNGVSGYSLEFSGSKE